MRKPPATLTAVAALFVASGAAGLVDQVCFSKYLSYVVGSTAHAVSAVLAAFMAGMALGAQLGGRFASRVRRPLVAYGVLELVVAATVALSPALFSLLQPAYVALVHALPNSLAAITAARWLMAVLVVVIPTTAMGATLPLLSRLVESTSEPAGRSRALGILYASNTLGGAAGSLASAYWVLPSLGLSRTTLAAAATSAVVGLLAMALGRGRSIEPAKPRTVSAYEPALATSEPEAEPLPTRAARVEDVVAFGSGSLVFACEVVFVHLLVLIVGTSTYAFGVILSIFLVCLFLGAMFAPVLHRTMGPAALALGLALTALALAGTLGVWQALPDYFRGMGERVTTFEGREAVRGSAAFVALFLPTTLMGLSFPLLLQSVAARPGVGRLVGRLTAINTVGSVVGSLAAGYWILPALGSQRTIVAVAVAFAALAIAVAITTRRAAMGTLILRTAAGVLAALAALVGLFSHPWDLGKLTGGYHVYFDWGRGEETIVSVSEDTQGGVTTVTEKDGVHTLLTNGKFQGNDGAEMHAQRFFAHYPIMFTKRLDRALVIGLGTGTTLGTVADYPFEHVEVAEISPAIVQASRTYFGAQGGDALNDPRVSLFLEDGRNHLLTSSATYDLIGLELTSVWFAGASSLYSREFYQLVKRRLAPDGVLQQWIQLHHIYPRDLATVIHTLRLEFAHVALFYGGGQGILVSSNAPLIASKAKLEALEASLGAHRPSRGLATLTVDVLAETGGLDAFVADAAREAGVPVESLVSTDDNLYLEYATPRGNVLPWSSREETVARLRQHRDGDAISTMIVE